ncbi:hypothetical protein N8G13_02890 [Mycoplasma zalophi]|uniref:hypothetical protein n=1 Tax=Mycoplasma zalophi TaxID=191287 RepID=UPI0021C58F88|nr:hypothetical protein [Mycoplasma zalophi]MCU4117389.1 hypothetical protein [Mycoplasma zalophi]
MNLNQKKLKKISGILAVSTATLAATTTAFIVEEARLKNLIQTQQKLWNNLNEFKNTELKDDEFLSKIVQDILDDNPVLNIFYDTFSKVKIKINNLKFSLQKFVTLVSNNKENSWKKFNSLKEEIKNYINNELKFLEYENLKNELQEAVQNSDNNLNSNSSQKEIDNQTEGLQDIFDQIKKNKAIKDDNIKSMAFSDYETALRKLNEFINDPLSLHDFYNELYSDEKTNRDEIIKDISFENSNVGDILEAKQKLIQELEDATKKAYKVSKQELQRVYDEAKVYSSEILITPDDVQTKEILLNFSKEKYDVGIESNEFEFVYDSISKITSYIESAKVKKYLNDVLRNHSIDTLKSAQELANNFLNDFSDNKYPDIKQYVSDILTTESQDIDSKTFDKIYESADKIIESLKIKKAEAVTAYNTQRAKLNGIKDELTEPKYESIKQEIINLITEKDAIINNPDSTTRDILDAVEILKSFESQIENKKQAKDNINSTFSEIENYIKTHTHPEDAKSINELQEALNSVKEKTKNSSNTAEIQQQNNELSIIFEKTKQKVNETATNREQASTEYETVANKANKLISELEVNIQKYPNLAEELKTKKSEIDEIVAKKDTESTSTQITQAKNDLELKLKEIEAKKDKIDLEESKTKYKNKYSEASNYGNSLDEEKYSSIKTELKNKIAEINDLYEISINSEEKNDKQKNVDVKEAIKNIQIALDKAKHDKETLDKNRKFQSYLAQKHLIENYIDSDLKDSKFKFIKDKLNEAIETNEQLLENDPDAAEPTLKDSVTDEQIQASIDNLTTIFEANKELKTSKDNFDLQVEDAETLLSKIKAPVLNKDDEELYNTLKNKVTELQKFFKDDNNKTKDNFDQKAKELSGAITQANDKYTENKAKRKQARINLQAKIDSIKQYVQDNLQENKDGTFVTKPEYIATERKILEELEKAKTIHDSASSTEKNLIDALNSLNDQEKILKASEAFDKQEKEASDFYNTLDDKLDKNVKNTLDLAITNETDNKISVANNFTKNTATIDETIDQINQAKENLNQALEAAKNQQLEIFQNAYDNLSKQADQLLTELDETNGEDANKHSKYPEIARALKDIKDPEDAKALSTSTPKPTIEILKESLPKLQKAYDDAVLAKSKSDFDKVYGDILDKFKDTEGSTKYQNLKNAVIEHLKLQKNIRDNDDSIAQQINEATEVLKSQISQLYLIKESFDEYKDAFKEVSDYNDSLTSENNESKDILTNALNTYKESNIGADNALNPEKYSEFKTGLKKALKDAKDIESSKTNYKNELQNTTSDDEFENYPEALKKYKKAIEDITKEDGSLAQDLKTAKTPEEIKQAYDNATNALKKAKEDIALNKAKEDYDKKVKELQTLKDSLNPSNQAEKAIIDELQNIEHSSKSSIKAKEDSKTIIVNDYTKTITTLDDAILKAKLDKSKIDYENTKQQAQATSNELDGNYPKTKQYYDEELLKIEKKLTTSLTEAGEDKQKQKEAYDAAKKAIETLNETLEAKKTEETNDNKAKYEKSLEEFNKTKQEAENIKDEALKAKIKTELNDAKNKADAILNSEPKTAAKYEEAKKILDAASNLAKTQEFDKLKADVEEYIKSDLNDAKYNQIKSDLESTKNSQDAIVHPTENQDKLNPETIKEAIEDLQDAFDNAKKQKAQKDFDDAYDALKNKGANDSIKKAIEKAVSDQKAVRDNVDSTTEEIKNVTTQLNNAEISNKITETNNKKSEYDEEIKKILSGEKLEEKFGNNERAKQNYLNEVKKAQEKLDSILNSDNSDLDSIKDAYNQAKERLQQLNSDANINQQIAADKYRQALESAKNKYSSLNDLEESKIKKDLGDIVTQNTIEEAEIDSTSTAILEEQTKALNDAVTKATQEQEKMKQAKNVYEAKVYELNSAKTTYPDFANELQTAINSSNSNISANQKAKTIQASDYNEETDTLRVIFDKVKAKDSFDKEYKEITDAVGSESKYQKIKKAIENDLKPQIEIRNNTNSSASNINQAKNNLHKQENITKISKYKNLLDRLVEKETELADSKTTLYSNDPEIQSYIQSVLGNENNLHNSITNEQALTDNAYSSRQNKIEETITNASNIKASKNSYTNSKTTLERNINAITGNSKAKELLSAEKNQIISTLNSDITSANNDPTKIKKAFDKATTNLNSLQNNIDWYKAVGEYEAKRKEVEDYKNSLTKPEYNKVKNVDLTNAISSADGNVNKTNKYSGKTAQEIRNQIKPLTNAKSSAQTEVANINTNKQSYDATVTEYTTFKNDAKYAEYKLDLETFLSNNQNSLTTKQNNNTIFSTDFSTAKSQLENKMRDVSALRYQKLSETVERYVNNTLKSDYYKDLKADLERTKNTEDSISLPNNNPTREQSEGSYSRLDTKFNNIKTRKQSRDNAINQMNTSRNDFQTKKSLISAHYNKDINIDSWIQQKIQGIEDSVTNAVNNGTLSDQTFLDAKQKYDNLEKEAYQEIAKQLNTKIEEVLSDPENDKIVESQQNYSRLSQLKNSLSKVNYNSSNYADAIKNIYDEAIQNIKKINDNKKEYEKAHKLAVQNLNKQKEFVTAIDNALVHLPTPDNRWGRSFNPIPPAENSSPVPADQNYVLKVDNQQFRTANTSAKTAYNNLEEEVNSKSIKKNKDSQLVNISNDIDLMFLTNNLNTLVNNTEKFIQVSKLNQSENGFINRQNDQTQINGFTRLSETRNLNNVLQKEFLESYKNNTNSNVYRDNKIRLINDYVEYRDKFFNSIKYYEQEMDMLKDKLKEFVAYDENGQPGKYVQQFRKLYSYLPFLVGYQNWYKYLTFFYNNLFIGTNEYENFDFFFSYDSKGQPINFNYKNIYEDVLRLQTSTTPGNNESIEAVIKNIENRAGNLAARNFSSNWPLKNYSQYYWKNYSTWPQFKLRGSSDSYVINEYIRKMGFSLLNKIPNKNKSNNLYIQFSNKLDSLKREGGPSSTQAVLHDYNNYQNKIKDVINYYFLVIDKLYEEKNNKEYKQLLLWDGSGANPENTTINKEIHYVDGNNFVFKLL